MTDPSPQSNDNGRIIRFRPRGASRSGWRWPAQRRQTDETPVADLSQYERGSGEDDFSHRMKMNALGLLVATVLIAVGIWLAVSIADMRKNQDCVLQGRPNCAQLKIPPAEH